MKFSSMVFAIGAVVLSACSNRQQTPPPLQVVAEVPAIAQQQKPMPPTALQLLAQQTPEVQAAIRQHQKDGKWPVYRAAVRVLYPYSDGDELLVNCAPLRTTDLY